ncbi:Uma2 family endonuclease [Amycolatopsis sp. GM8]|uniref:Uma2 family endonuclease n=1 Tax=Amycolatopsis sp. GM8 TaxID=2896530 RepID=UPI001F1A0A69|nr:Uma2 family endonuclease [Amycolatopsis sp. GM8]
MLGPVPIEEWFAAEHPSDGSRLELILGHLHVTPPQDALHQHAMAKLAFAADKALGCACRADLTVLPGVGVRISTPLRTALIPDVVVVDIDSDRPLFDAENVLLAVEVWSSDNTKAERETKVAAYAATGVPYLWLAEAGTFKGYRLTGNGYRLEVQAEAGETITAPGPVPVKIDTSELA